MLLLPTLSLLLVQGFFKSSPFLAISRSLPAFTMIAWPISLQGTLGQSLLCSGAWSSCDGFGMLQLQQFQLVHPLTIVCLLTKVPPTILERGWFLLALAQTPASHMFLSSVPSAVVPLAPANNSAGSIAHGSHASSSLLMHASLVTYPGGDPPSAPLLLDPQGALLPSITAAPPCRPYPEGPVDPAVLMGMAHTIYGGQFSCGHFPGPYHGGSHRGPLHGGSLQAVSPGHCYPSSSQTRTSIGSPLTSLAVSMLLSCSRHSSHVCEIIGDLVQYLVPQPHMVS